MYISLSLPQTGAYFAIGLGCETREGAINSSKAGTRTGAYSRDQAGAADTNQNADGNSGLAQLAWNIASAYGQSAPDIAGGSRTAVSGAALSPLENPNSVRPSLASLPDDQRRVLDVFWQDPPLGAAPPVSPQALAIRPYMVAAAFMILIAGGTVVYLTGSAPVLKQAPDRRARAAAIAPSGENPLDRLDERNIRQSRAFVPSQPVLSQPIAAQSPSQPAAVQEPSQPVTVQDPSQPITAQGVSGEQDWGQAAPTVSPPEEDALLKRGAIFLKNGDVSAARLNFENLALRGSAKGAFALAQSFDPTVLRSIAVAGLRPDLLKAKEWYAKAAALGDEEAGRQLSALNATW